MICRIEGVCAALVGAPEVAWALVAGRGQIARSGAHGREGEDGE